MCGRVAGLIVNLKCSILGHGWKFCGGAVRVCWVFFIILSGLLQA